MKRFIKYLTPQIIINILFILFFLGISIHQGNKISKQQSTINSLEDKIENLDSQVNDLQNDVSNLEDKQVMNELFP